MQRALDEFNKASSSTVLLGTLGATGLLYLLVKAYSHRKLISGAAIKQIRSMPGAKSLVNRELEKTIVDLENSLRIQGDQVNTALPQEGWSHEEIISAMKKLKEAEEHRWKDGKVSGAVYHGGEGHTDLMNAALSLFTWTNPLHPDVFPAIRKFEAEIVAMTVDMLAKNVPGVVGALTSGGSESILMAVKAHREYYAKRGITQPEMIVPASGHAAFQKASNYFGVKYVEAPLGDDYRVDINAVKNLINQNTILLVGSAPNYAHGMIDDVQALAALAKQHDIGCHVDGCLGGFLLPWLQQTKTLDIPAFDFRVDGVTSMSADTHKYGYSVKGTSVILFRNSEYRKSMYFMTTEWNGGIYASPSMSGSRPGALIAATWASLMSFGKNGYTEAAIAIGNMQKVIKQGIIDIDGLELIGNSHTMVIAFSSSKYNIFSIKEAMQKRGWSLNALQKPNGIHICITYNQVKVGGEQFIKDLNDSIEEIKRDPPSTSKGDAHLYGVAYGFPDRTLIEEIVTGYLDTCLKP